MGYLSYLALLGIAAGLAMDAFAVSISYGCGLKRFSIKVMVYVTVAFALFQGGMTWLGWLLSDFFDDYIRAVDHWVAFGLLVFIGIKMIIEACTAADECEVIDCDHFDFGRLLVLAVATSIDALAVGISLRVLQADILIPALIIGAVTAVFSIVGVSAGHRLKAFLGRKTEILGGIILIFIGIRILVTHLMS